MTAASPPGPSTTRRSAPGWQITFAFMVVYVVWGSTYLAIRYGIATIPPFFMASARFLAAGAVLYAWCRLRGAARPTSLEWRATLIVGTLLLVLGNGGVTWAEQRLPSGVTALLVATEPLWLVGLAWASRTTGRPTWFQFLGVGLGLAGVAFLMWPSGHVTGQGGMLVSAGVVLVAACAWAAGSLYAPRAPLPSNRAFAAGMQMLTAGALLAIAGLATGETSQLNMAHVSMPSIIGLAYLAVFGSLVAFSAYSWLLDKATPARLSTYAYVNPMIAVLLGWLIAGEPLGIRALGSMALIVVAVILLTLPREAFQRGQAASPSSAPTGDAGNKPSLGRPALN
jgi:drug/metabolite transporter (DMT)-like permease